MANNLGTFEMVGSLVNGGQRHEGHSGLTIKQIHDIKSTWLPFNADIILVHLGTNDMCLFSGNVGAKDSALRMDLMLNDTFTALPNTHVFLASITSSVYATGGWKHAQFNKLLQSLMNKYATKNFKITFVDMAVKTGLCSSEGFCPDHVHPQGVGYEKMAQVWFEALSASYNSSILI